MNGNDERVEVQVESLELEGVAVREPEWVRAAFEGELSRLLTEEGLPEHALGRSARDAVDGGSLSTADFSSPESLGKAVARRVYAELIR